jgi:nucleotide-binding universal stress UspA family protein
MTHADLFARPLIPVASDEDARATAEAAFPRVAAVGGRPTVLHVIEKAGGAPDKASVEQREAAAEAAFDAVRDVAATHDLDVGTDLRYHTDVATAIFEAAADTDATAIVFRPRGGSGWLDLLTGNVRDDIVTGSDRPVVVLPAGDEGGADA